MEKLPNTIVRNGTYYVHVRIPKNLVESYGGKLFKTKSLDTKKPKEALRKLHDEMVKINHEFDEKRAAVLAAKAQEAAPAPSSVPTLSFAEIARQHAREVSDKEFAERARMFEAATADDSEPFWKGEVVPLPGKRWKDEPDPRPESRYFDHLVEDGDLDKIVGYITRTRVKDRVAELRRMLAIGNLGELAAIADERFPGMGCGIGAFLVP